MGDPLGHDFGHARSGAGQQLEMFGVSWIAVYWSGVNFTVRQLGQLSPGDINRVRNRACPRRDDGRPLVPRPVACVARSSSCRNSGFQGSDRRVSSC